MHTVDVTLKRVEILSFDARTKQVGFRLILNDGKDKAIQRQDDVDDPQDLASGLFQDVRKKMKELHRSHSIDDGPLEGVTMVRIKGDEELLIERIGKFFATVKEKMRNGQMRKLSYYDLERQIIGLKTDL
ncbi:hypothetical protein HY492_04315 [Candidatus Woesearchaeota archaeon]|nr:hypothetical protein [Candidatus Woesearchaeota archaeon]